MEMNNVLIKEMLEFVKREGHEDGRHLSLCIPGYSDNQIQYHARLCVQGGFFTHLKGPTTLYPIELTLTGHRKLRQLQQSDDPRNCDV